MDWLTFIAELVKAMAWPLAIVVLALLFQTQLIALLSRIRKGKFGAAEFEFEENVKALQKQAIELPPAAAPRSAALIISDPRHAILESWRDVEDAARQLLQKLGTPTSVLSSRAPVLIRVLEEQKAVSATEASLFMHLRQLRNEAAQTADFSPSLSSALRYTGLADGLSNAIRLKIEN